jgi:hypothetical protein
MTEHKAIPLPVSFNQHFNRLSQCRTKVTIIILSSSTLHKYDAYIFSINSSTLLQLDIALFLTVNECLQRDEYVECKPQLQAT